MERKKMATLKRETCIYMKLKSCTCRKRQKFNVTRGTRKTENRKKQYADEEKDINLRTL